MRLLGAELTHVGLGRVRVSLSSRPEISQQHGELKLVALGQQTLISVPGESSA